MDTLSGYINDTGIVTAKRNASSFPGDGNGILQTGLAVACGMYDKQSAMAAMNLCFGSKYPMIWRSMFKQNDDDDQKCDDYWGAFVIGSKSWAKDLIDYCEDHNWYICVNEKKNGGIDYYFGRFIAFESLARIVAGKHISLIHQLVLFCAIIYDSFFLSKADGNMKAFCRLTVATSTGLWLPMIAAAIWKLKVKHVYGSIGASWAEYFEEGHPLSKFNS